MAKLSHCTIEYVLNPDGSPGYGWPVFTGCGQPPEVCLTHSTCWARLMHCRFGSEQSTRLGKKYPWNALYNLDFSLRFNDHLLEAPFGLRKPSTIAVSFMGDMFGPGLDHEVVKVVLKIVAALPQHTFLFLTKSPENLPQFNSWPPNAWVGCTITGGESEERQQQMMSNLCEVEGGKRWVSYEPMLGPFLMAALLVNLDWLVLGAQSGPGKVKPKLDWVLDIIKAADRARVKLWIKRNLQKLYPELPVREELPFTH